MLDKGNTIQRNYTMKGSIITCLFAFALTMGEPVGSQATQSEKTVSIGGNVTLKCSFYFDDLWKLVTWEKDNHTIYHLNVKSNISTTNDTKYEGSNHGKSFMIKDLKKTDSGIYNCKVETLILIMEGGQVLLSVTDQEGEPSTTSPGVPSRAFTTVPPQPAEDNKIFLTCLTLVIIPIIMYVLFKYRERRIVSRFVGARKCLVFNDPIHSSFKMPKHCQIIIDTPEFQRLRSIKQLGCASYVFPSAVHTRFEHSIGVSYLGGKLASMLQQNERNSSTPIQNTEVACVEIAGLCHDLGHGAFSHAFEDIIPPDKDGKKWKHEEQSVILFKYLIKHNSLEKKLEEHNIYAKDIDFICQLILGVNEGEERLRENKFYLYQIVNNSVNRVDVDKWDYIARDTHYLGMKSAFDFNRILPFVMVLDVKRGSKTRRELCFRDKVASDLSHMFLTRCRLHYTSYQHRVSKIITIMLKDALKEAADHLSFVGEGRKEYSLLDSVKDPEAFCQVDDTIVNDIMQSRSQESGMVRAREIIHRIHKRELYQCIAEVKHANKEMITTNPAEIKRLIVNDVDEVSSPSSLPSNEMWRTSNIEVEVSHFAFGSGDRNPLLDIPFFKKSRDGKFYAEFISEDKLTAELPQRLLDVTVRIYTKVPKLDLETINEARSRCTERLGMVRRSVQTTPVKQKVKSQAIGPMAPSTSMSAVSRLTSLISGSGIRNLPAAFVSACRRWLPPLRSTSTPLATDVSYHETGDEESTRVNLLGSGTHCRDEVDVDDRPEEHSNAFQASEGTRTNLPGSDTHGRDDIDVDDRPEEHSNAFQGLVINDPIHGSVQMANYCQMIIDTPEFQRLRFTKQLGCTCCVFPSAVHTRFEHSIGVSHLGGKLASMLQQNVRDSSTPILNSEVACVEIAGLCHDLGHGPFSHAFEDIIQAYEYGKKWKPEEQSVIMLKYLIKHNSLEKKLEEHNIYAKDIDFICQLILGVKEDEEMLRENKFYLYQIVNNSVNGVDVDKWDYIPRDTYYLGMKSAFDFNRILPFVKVLDVKRGDKTRRELCFRDKVASDLNQMFLTRRRLHYKAYQHRVTKIINIMLKDAFKEAADHPLFVGEGGKEYNLMESVKDPEAFCQVNDTIVNNIMRSRSQVPGMVKAREIIDRIHKRELYQCIAEVQHANEEMGSVDPAEIKRLIVNDVDELSSPSSSSSSEIWHAHNIEVEVSRFDYGSGDRNPLLDIPFFKKSRDGKFDAELLPEDKLPVALPQRLLDVTLRIYTKVPKLDRETINKARSRCTEKLEMILGKRRFVPTRPSKQKVISAVSPLSSPSSGSGSFVSTDVDAGFQSLISNTPDAAAAAVGTGTTECSPRGSRSPEPEVKITLGSTKRQIIF